MLYAIVDVDALRGRDPLEFAQQVLDGGAAALQLRAKHTPDDQMAAWATAMARLCRGSVPFFVNDRADIAAMVGSGLHVGQDDLPVAACRAVAPGAALGLSTHTVAQVAAGVAAGVDLLGFGPVFPSSTRQGHAPATGLAGLASAVGAAGATPVVAIGGVGLGRAGACIRAGATYVAVIAALCQSQDPKQAARTLARECLAARG